MPAAARNAMADSYMTLILEFPLRRIRSLAEHNKAKQIVLRLSAEKPDRGAIEYLDVLVNLIAEYEARSEAAIETSGLSAADLVRHRIDERGISVSALAHLIGVPQSNLSDMLNGKRDWSKAAIRGLSARLNIRAERLLG